MWQIRGIEACGLYFVEWRGLYFLFLVLCGERAVFGTDGEGSIPRGALPVNSGKLKAPTSRIAAMDVIPPV